MPIFSSVNERKRKSSVGGRGHYENALLKIKIRRRNRRMVKTTSCGYKEA
jgi:hypothetical protein